MTFDELVGAVYRRDLAEVAKANRADVNQTDDDGRTLLMHAILAEHPAPELVRLLLDKGADPDVADTGQRWTALHFAARDERAELVSILLDAGAAVDPVDAFENTPLWRAVSECRGELGAVQVLVDHGADPARKNGRGISPRRLAQQMGRGDLVELLG